MALLVTRSYDLWVSLVSAEGGCTLRNKVALALCFWMPSHRHILTQFPHFRGCPSGAGGYGIVDSFQHWGLLAWRGPGN